MEPINEEEVKRMDEKRNVQDLHSVSSDVDSEGHERERRLSRAFAALRLLSDKDDNLSPKQATARARREAENFRRWKESGASIREVVVRLSDGREIAVEKTIITGFCGFHFVRKFAHGEVLHIYKKTDREFGEVLLHSVNIDDIESDGYVYEKTYATEQMVQLKIEHRRDGQLHVSIDYTPAEDERAVAATGRLHSALPFAVPILLGVAHWWRRTGRSGTFQPSRGFAALLITSVLVLSWLYTTKGRTEITGHASAIPGRVAPGPSMASGAEGASEDLARQVNLAGQALHGRTSVRVPNEAELQRDIRALHRELQALRQSRKSAADTALNSREDQNSADAVSVACEAKLTPEQKPKANKLRSSNEKRPLQVNSIALPDSKSQLAIYVKAHAHGNTNLTTKIEEAFVFALRNTKQFVVITDINEPNAPADAYRVDLWFTQKEGCRGTITAELYAGENNRIWNGEKDCHEYPTGDVVTQASQQLVANMVTKLEEMKGGDSKNNKTS